MCNIISNFSRITNSSTRSISTGKVSWGSMSAHHGEEAVIAEETNAFEVSEELEAI